MRRNENLPVILASGEMDMFVAVNYKLNPPRLFLTPKMEDSVMWNINEDTICDADCKMFWDFGTKVTRAFICTKNRLVTTKDSTFILKGMEVS